MNIESDNYVAQVKHQASAVGVKALRELVGVASVKGKQPIFAAKSGYSADALEFGQKSGMILFAYRRGDLVAHTTLADHALSRGL